MKALFLIFHDFDPANGISKKIQAQVRALKANGLETHLCYLQENASGKRRIANDQVIADYGRAFYGKIRKRLEYHSVVNYAISHQIDIVYMRSNHNANPFTIGMLRQMKKAGIQIVMEIPTYPYDQEYITPFMKAERFIDRCFRKKLAHLLNAIVTFSDYKIIFGVPTIQISNGIDFSEIPVKKQVNNTDRELHLIGVAEIHYWHGYDRLIRGLAEYYTTPQTYKVYFHIVGDLSGQRERDELLPVIAENHLESYVIFHGKQHGEALEQLFEQCDFGIGSLGRHRSGIHKIKTLKNREYAARGIPFIYSETDEDFEKMPYILKAPEDESSIDIAKIIRFYPTVHLSPQEIRNTVRHLSWEEQMKLVLEKIPAPISTK